MVVPSQSVIHREARSDDYRGENSISCHKVNNMNHKIEFLINAIKDNQLTNDLLDKKAATIVALETTLGLIIATGFLGIENFPLIKEIGVALPRSAKDMFGLSILVYAAATLYHIILTLKVIFPQESPDKHILFGDMKPRKLYFLHRMNEHRQMLPSLTEYVSQIHEFSDAELINEYSYELQKISYIRKVKSDHLLHSIRFLKAALIVLVAIISLIIIFLVFKQCQVVASGYIGP
jgi:hypothetical protein